AILSSRGTFGLKNIIFGFLRCAPNGAALRAVCCVVAVYFRTAALRARWSCNARSMCRICAIFFGRLRCAQEVLRHAPCTVV
ncbi:hypothetical protein A2U01_0068388, partial [Trifolium medium]|nr:hypothetical protein [Trifolium medium]